MASVLIWAAVGIFLLASQWVLFSKAGEAGWKSIVPVYGAIVFLRIVGRPWWWLVLLMAPFVNLIPACILCWDLARVFGKGSGFAVGIALLPFVFVPMLAFGSAQYVGPNRSESPGYARAA